MKPLRIVLMILVLIQSGCKLLDAPPPVEKTHALPPADQGLLDQVADQFEAANPGKDGFKMVVNNKEALEWRLALVENATQSIDLQYFLWEDNETAWLLFERVLAAADRGVRVRMLVDDLVLEADDSNLATLDAEYPNFNIKIFNPGRIRESTLGGWGEFLLNFKELNRRMHNKLFVVDNRIAIIGGRNIGNEYFGLGANYNMHDLDVVTLGPVVPQISKAFDDYWNDDEAYPGFALSDERNPGGHDAVQQQHRQAIEENQEMLVSYPIDPPAWRQMLLNLPARMDIGISHFIQDEPQQTNGEQLRLIDMINILAAPAHEEFTLVTPYLIPLGSLLDDLKQLTSEGVRIRIITNSMASNNHTATNSKYKKYRWDILDAGVELYELKQWPSAEVILESDVPPVVSDFITLHMKALVGDRQRCFIGSLNLDPRAVKINTENGLYIISKQLCGRLAAKLDELMQPNNAWRVYLDEEYRLRWSSDQGIRSWQPSRGTRQRGADAFYRVIPIENQL